MYLSYDSVTGLADNASTEATRSQSLNAAGGTDWTFRRISDEGIAHIRSVIKQITWYFCTNRLVRHVCDATAFKALALAGLSGDDAAEFRSRVGHLDSAPEPLITHVPYLNHDGTGYLPGPGMPQFAIDYITPTGEVMSH